MVYALRVGDRVLGRYDVRAPVWKDELFSWYLAESVGGISGKVLIKLAAEARSAVTGARFEREAEILARVQHGNLIQLVDCQIGTDRETFLVLRHLPGERLDDVLRDQGPLPWDQAVAIINSALSAIESLHTANVLIRSLNPQSLLVKPDLSSATIINLHRAKPTAGFDGNVTGRGEIVDPKMYLAPELLFEKRIGRRADNYSVGLVLHEMLTGRLPYRTSSLREALSDMYRDYDPPTAPTGLPAIPEALQDLLLKVLSPEPVERPDSSREFLDGLRKIRRDRRLPSARRPNPGRPPIASPSASAVVEPFGRPPATRPEAPAQPAPPPASAQQPVGRSPFRTTQPPLASKLLCRLALNLPDANSPASSVRWWLSTQLPSDARLEQRSSTVWWAILQVTSQTAADKLGRGMQDAANMQFGEHASIEWKVVQH